MQKRHLLFILLLTVIMPWVSRAQETLTVYEGTSTSNVIPAYIFYFDDFTRSQFVIPAADLEIMSGSTITSIKFYTTNSNVPYTTVSTADVYLKEVDYTTISAFEPKTNIVYQGTLDVVSEDGDGSLTITLATPYTYGGGNLLVGIENTTNAGYKNISFYGTSVTGASVGAYNGSSLDNVTPTQRDFIPKTTFTYIEPAPATPSCNPSFSRTSDYIASFSLGSISNTNSGFSSGGYGNFASMSTELEQGSTVNASLTSSDGSGDHFVGVWIDFNNDGTFDESTEKVSNYSTSIGPSVTVQIPLEIPDNAALGNHIMRVLYRYNQAPTPCISASFGEGEDYMVKIAPTYITEINDENDWEAFCEAVNSGHTYSGATVNLNADISVTTMAGTSTNVQVGRNAFKGIFDGHGHTLTIDLVKGTSTHTAPFVYINGATIKDLKVEGEINIGDNQLAGGLVGISVGTNTITNCKVNVTINSSVSGDGTHGGFISLVQGGIITFNGCAFTGKLLGANTHSCGGFVGYSRGTSKFFNCVFAPQQLSFDSNNCSTFARNGNSFTNCYYTDALGTVQGKEMFTITSLSPVTVAMSDTATNTYDVSDINTYTAGIVYGNTIYAGDGDTISLTLTGADLYGVDHGELMVSGQNYTLVMAAYNTLISEVSCSVPTGLVVTTDSETPYGATITWTENGYATAWIVEYADNDAFTNSAVEDANGILTHTFSGLDSETTYYVRVRANCGGNDGTSGWSIPTTFTTLEACPAPNVVVNNITHTNATVAWTGFSDSYTVALGHEGEPITLFIDFEDQTVPTGWTLNNDTAWIVVEGNGGYCLQSNNAGLSNSTSSISLTYMYYTNGTIEFDAECMGEGTNSSSSYWDHCDFYIDETRALYAGANISGWNHYTFNVTKGEHTFMWSYTKDGTVNPSGDYFAVDNVTLNSANLIWESPSIIENTEHTFDSLTIGTDYFVKVQGICDDIQSEESIVIFSTLPESQRVFVTEGNWNNAANWSGDIPNINNEVIVRANAIVPSGCVAEADIITFEGTPTPTLTIADGGQLKTNNNVTATVKKNITGYGMENVDTNNGYYLIAAPTTPSTSASDAGLITTTADNEPTYDLYGWDRTATDEEWQNTKNFGYYYLYNGNGYLYANLNDMEMSITGTMLRSDEPVTMTAYHNSIAGGWNLFGNPFTCNAYVYRPDGAPMDVMFYDTNGDMVTLNGGPVAPMQGFFVKVTETTTVVIKSMPAYVDLGLPSGLLWATCNVGATTPEGNGDYFAWGETQPKEVYNWSTYQYCDGNRYTLTKYCGDSIYGNGGFTDSLTTLLPEDDAAAANMGAGWRMPTSVEWAELYNNTTNIWTTQNGVYGRLFTAPNGSTLFLPNAGYRYDGDLLEAGSFGYYWSSSLNTADPDCAKHFGFNSDYYGVDYNGRRFGYAVRAVRSSSQSSSFTATTEHQGGRTILDPNNGQVNWTAGDQMVIGKDNGETAVFTLQSGEGTIEGVFAASNGFGTVGTFIAAYPSDAVIENGKVTFNLPSTQAIAEAETFANGANPMVACSDDNNLSFKNLCGGLGIRLKGLGAHVTAIRITSMDTTEKLWGTYEVSNCNANEPSLTMASGNQGTNVIALTCDVNLTTAAKTFFVMLPPGTLAAGFTVEVFDGEEILTTMETTSDAFSVERNSLKFFNEILIDIDFDGNVEIPSDLNGTDIVVTNLGEDAIPDENGDFFIGYSTTLTMKNATNNEVIYMSIPSVNNDMAKGEGQLQNYDLNAKETALYYALTVIPFALCQTEDATFNSIKDVLYDLACVKALENAIEQSVNQNGYLRSEDIEDELNALWDYLREELLAPFMETQSLCSGGNMGHIVLEANGNSRLEQPQLSDNGRYKGIRLDLESAVFNESSDTWTINLTGYSDNGVFIGMQKGSIGNDGKAYPIEERPHYFLPPMNMGKFMGTFTSFSGIASYFSDTWRLFFEDGFGFDDMTWDKAKLENISFELNRNEDALVMLSPKDNQATAVVNGVYAIMQVVGMALDDILTSRGYSAFFTSLFSNQELCAKISGIAGHPENFQTAATSLLNWAENLFLTGEFQQFINPKYNLDKILDKITSSTSRAVLEYAGNTIGTLASWYLFDSFFFTVEAEYNSILPTVSTTSCEVLSPTQAAVVAELESMGTHSVTEMGVCYSTTILPTVNNNCVSYSSIQTPGSYQCQLNDLQPNTTYYARAYAKCPLDVVVYGNRVRFTTGNAPTGFINGLFTINGNGDQVQFSQGNLQYQASTNTWRFAENQWDYVGTQSPSYYGDPGGTVGGSDNVNISQTYDGWIDLFGWGTSGYNHGAVSYQPWSTIQNYSDYFAYGIDTCNLYDQTGQADWGYNAKSNGGNTENCGWRTLTQPEWNYVINSRNTSSGIRYAKAKVNNVNGMILLPDNWNTSYYSLNNTNSASDASYSDNVISATQWTTLEQHGVVFLPAAGYRYGTSVGFTGSEAAYWSASYYDSNRALYVYFDSGNLDPNIYNGSRSDGQSVRLVRSGSTSFIINATANPVEGGMVNGGGTYQEGTDCSLTAMANEGYSFTSWTENGEVVSTNFTYSFTVSSNRNLVANFVVSGGSSHEYVDLGLPSGLLWATCNVGAESPEDYGDYFAWGETTTKDRYLENYQYSYMADGIWGLRHLTKYCNNSAFGYNGFTDHLTTLLPEDDAATANWGEGWRMATYEEWYELLNNTTNAWATRNGVNGRLFTAPNGASLFLPAAGGRWNEELLYTGGGGYYWSSSLGLDTPDGACFLNISEAYYADHLNNGYYRCYGFSVRPVREN